MADLLSFDKDACLRQLIRYRADRILFGKYAGTEIKFRDKDYLILREDEIVGILTQAGQAAGRK